jgi:hypothetical protein
LSYFFVGAFSVMTNGLQTLVQSILSIEDVFVRLVFPLPRGKCPKDKKRNVSIEYQVSRRFMHGHVRREATSLKIL